MAEDLSFFGGGNKEFVKIFNASRKEDYDMLYLSVQNLEARRNHDELLWSKKEGMVGSTEKEDGEVGGESENLISTDNNNEGEI